MSAGEPPEGSIAQVGVRLVNALARYERALLDECVAHRRVELMRLTEQLRSMGFTPTSPAIAFLEHGFDLAGQDVRRVVGDLLAVLGAEPDAEAGESGHGSDRLRELVVEVIDVVELIRGGA